MSLQSVIRQARATAARTQEPCAVLNMNRVGAPLYVIRSVPPPEVVEREGKGWLVETVTPDGCTGPDDPRHQGAHCVCRC